MKIAGTIILLGALLSLATPALASTATVNLGAAETFSVLAKTVITKTLASTISGEVGDRTATTAQADMDSAYSDAASRAATSTFTGDNNGRTFTAGVHQTGAAFALTGTMTLDGEGNPGAVFIFNIDAALGTAAGSEVTLVNGANANNVFWRVGGAVSTGADSRFVGTLMSKGAITLGARSALHGRALSGAAVTLAGNIIVTSVPAPLTPTPEPTPTPTPEPEPTPAPETAPTPSPAPATPPANCSGFPNGCHGVPTTAKPTVVVPKESPAIVPPEASSIEWVKRIQIAEVLVAEPAVLVQEDSYVYKKIAWLALAALLLALVSMFAARKDSRV